MRNAMTRHHPDMRAVHDQWSTGEAVGVGVLFVVALMVAIGVVALLAHLMKGTGLR